MEILVLVLALLPLLGLALAVFSRAGSGRRSTDPGAIEPARTPPPRRIAPERAPSPQPNPTWPPIPADLTLTGKAYVIDGDTIRIGKTKIRLAGIDAPEIDMPWGQKSKWAMVAICKGRTITAKLDGCRSYDRLVGTCVLPDGRDIGAEIIKQGLALDLAHFSGGKYRHLEPAGARNRLANGKFGHVSIQKRQSTEIHLRYTGT